MVIVYVYIATHEYHTSKGNLVEKMYARNVKKK